MSETLVGMSMRALGHCFTLLFLAVACIAPLPAIAQSPLPKTIRIVVPFSAGGSNDVIARAIAVPLSRRLDIPVIV